MSHCEVTAWGGLALFKQILHSMGFRQVAAQWGLPEPRSNRGYAPLQRIEQLIVSIGCGACRFVHAETVRLDGTLVRLFGWTKAAGHKAIMRWFARFDRLANERVQAEVYRWFFGRISTLKQVTLGVDSAVITRNGGQEGAVQGYNPSRRGRASHHPLLAFVAEARMVANFWLRPGHAHSANNILQFLEATLHHLGDKSVGLLRADSGFCDEAVLAALEGKRILYLIAARLTQPLQRTIDQVGGGWALETGLELTELRYRAVGWETERRLIVVRQSVKRKTAPGNTLSLCAEDPDIQGWRYGTFVTTLDLPMVEVWRTYRGRADCENRIKELKADFGLEAFNMRDFWAIEAALGFAMLAYNLMSLFRQAVRSSPLNARNSGGRMAATPGMRSRKIRTFCGQPINRPSRAWAPVKHALCSGIAIGLGACSNRRLTPLVRSCAHVQGSAARRAHVPFQPLPTLSGCAGGLERSGEERWTAASGGGES